MQLIYVKYIPKNKSMLMFNLGIRNRDTLCGLVTDKVTDEDRAKILASKDIFKSNDVASKVNWLKRHCPSSLRAGFRAIKLSNANIMKKYDIK